MKLAGKSVIVMKCLCLFEACKQIVHDLYCFLAVRNVLIRHTAFDSPLQTTNSKHYSSNHTSGLLLLYTAVVMKL